MTQPVAKKRRLLKVEKVEKEVKGITEKGVVLAAKKSKELKELKELKKEPSHYLSLWCCDGDMAEKIRATLSGREHVKTMKDEGDKIRMEWIWKERQGDKDVYTTRTKLARDYIHLLTASVLKECLHECKQLNKTSHQDLHVKYEITQVVASGIVK